MPTPDHTHLIPDEREAAQSKLGVCHVRLAFPGESDLQRFVRETTSYHVDHLTFRHEPTLREFTLAYGELDSIPSLGPTGCVVADLRLKGEPFIEALDARDDAVRAEEVTTAFLLDCTLVGFLASRSRRRRKKEDANVRLLEAQIWKFPLALSPQLSNEHQDAPPTPIVAPGPGGATEQVAPFTDELTAALHEGRIGLLDAQGGWALSPSLDTMGALRDGRARARQGGKWGYLDATGAFAIPVRFDDEPGPFEGGRAIVIVDGRHGVIDHQGDWLIPPSHDGIAELAGGLHAFQHGQKWGYLRPDGEVAIPPTFDQAGSFAGGLAAVRRGAKFGYVRADGSFAVKPRYEVAGELRDGRARVKENGRCGFIGPDGEQAIPARFLGASSFEGDLAIVKTEAGRAFIDRSGAVVVDLAPLGAEETGPFVEGLAPVRVAGKWGYVDRAGVLRIACGFDDAQPFSDGLGVVRGGRRFGAILPDGTMAIEPRWSWLGPFHGGVAIAVRGGEAGAVDRAGEERAPFVHVGHGSRTLSGREVQYLLRAVGERRIALEPTASGLVLMP